MSGAELQKRLRGLPSVDALLSAPEIADLLSLYGRDALVQTIRDELDHERARILTILNTDNIDNVDSRQSTLSTLINMSRDAWTARITEALDRRFLPTLRPIINATGVIVHTNLGRAPLSNAAVDAMTAVAQGYSTLEFDLETGKRGSRLLHAEALLCEITGAEAALVVNNNAAATVLALAELAHNRGVIVSRGQLVEIGGGFRVPDIMRQSGAHLVEVGTTNRTRIRDYESAIDDQTALLMRVHSSNFKLVGFTESASLMELSALAHQRGLLVFDDLGSGSLIDTVPYGLDHEPTVLESVAADADVIAFSGDKLLGGPQAGVLIGKADVINRLKRHPLARAFRADKLCLAALSATLDHYRKGEALTHIPVWQIISAPLAELKATAEQWATALTDISGMQVSVQPSQSTVGGGSLPGASMPTWALAIQTPQPDALLARLRGLPKPIIARIEHDIVLLDPRTVLAHQHGTLLDGLRTLS
jgi:L-seryl-tRNA(Ser) seleniumtransferase